MGRGRSAVQSPLRCLQWPEGAPPLPPHIAHTALTGLELLLGAPVQPCLSCIVEGEHQKEQKRQGRSSKSYAIKACKESPWLTQAPVCLSRWLRGGGGGGGGGGGAGFRGVAEALLH